MKRNTWVTLAALMLCAASTGFGAVTQIGLVGTFFAVGNTLTSFTVPAGADRLLVVGVSDSAATAITSVTFGGTPLTQFFQDNDGITAVDSIWFLKLGTSASPIGGNIVMASSQFNADKRFMCAVAYSGVDQTTPMSGAQSENIAFPGPVSSSLLNITTSTGDMVFDLIDSYLTASQAVPTVGAGQTQLSLGGGALLNGFASYKTSSRPGGTPSVPMFWSISPSSEAMIHVAANIRQVPATPSPTSTPTPTRTQSPTPSPSPTPTATATATRTATPTSTPTSTETPTATETDTPTATESATESPSATETPTPTATDTPTASPTETPSPTPTVSPGREFGDFDDSGCTDIDDFLFLLDNWFVVSTIGPPAIGIQDFLNMLDYWQTGVNCP